MKRLALGIMVSCLLVGLAAALPAIASGQSLMMATTTSTDNTGLLDELAPMFKKDTGVTLKWTAVGTGKALEMGRNCDVDVLLVHAPPAERAFVSNGYGVDRTEVMYNDFVIIGPKGDPAGISGMSVLKALESLRNKEALFISRGDDSGTNKKELGLWKEAGGTPPDKASWYLETGQGMLATIRIAAERSGYTLTDRGTYIKYSANAGSTPMDIVVQGDKALFNQYSVIAVDPESCPDAQYKLAKRFIQWMTAGDTQQAIGDFRLLGKTLFTPNAE